MVQRQADPRWVEEGPGNLRQRRLHGVHRLPGAQDERRGPGSGGRGPGPARRARGTGRDGGRRRDAHRRGDDAGDRREAVLRQPYLLHRQWHHARQRHPPRNAPRRRGRVQHRIAQVQRPPSQPARLLQDDQRAGPAGDEGRQDRGPRQRGRRHAEAGGAESQPAHLRCRRLAIRGGLRPARVSDRELPRPRRESDDIDAGRQPVAELPTGVHRAVSLRPQHHRRLRHLQARPAVHRLLHPELDWRQPLVRVPGGRLQPDVRDLLLRAGRDG